MSSERESQEARKDFARRLRRLIDAAQINQNELSRQLDLSHSAIGDWFTKFALPSAETLVRMFKLPAFKHVSAEYLLTGDGPQLKSVAVRSQQAYDLGGITALTQAAEEVDRLKRAWYEAHAVRGTTASDDAQRAARAVETVEAVRKATSHRRTGKRPA